MDNHIARTAGFARLELNILREVIALVQQADRGDPFSQRGAELFTFRDRRLCLTLVRQFLGNVGLFSLWFRRAAGAACHNAGRQKNRPSGKAGAGFHASGAQDS
ncbi:hypothetical protein ACFOWT_15455 [Croceibacterium xixiisoli]|uniref:hypothetical protein n=1 Tax=Croceibacterium xixiisoli TaxID=1476466 RepID=UPI001F485C98|nr:hypothetical protein [Croceibacterium xixiisoli]